MTPDSSMSTTSPDAPATTVPLQLPEPRIVRQFCSHANGWSDQYGALQLAAAHAGLTLPAAYTLRGFWHHGCLGPWYEFDPGMLCSNSAAARTAPLFVARREQADYLQANQYAQPRAIGLPIVYTAPTGVARMPGSLLVVPTHTLAGDKYPDQELFDRYADEIAQVAGDFTRVVVCVHPNCRKNGLWVKEFTSRGFEVIYGAQSNDANALVRMRALFEQFETVTTNGWGSHVAYALAFGARVSIGGTEPVRSKEDYLRDTSWASNQAALEIALAAKTKENERAFLRDFFVPASAAVANQDLGLWLIGAEHKVSPVEMKAILATLIGSPASGPTPPPVGPLTPEQMTEARRARLRHCDTAEALVKAGNRMEAVQLLIRVVKGDVASKHPVLIVEGLVQIGDALAALEPKHSAYLLNEADRVARLTGVTVADVRARLSTTAAMSR